jgi:hypothetical protein
MDTDNKLTKNNTPSTAATKKSAKTFREKVYDVAMAILHPMAKVVERTSLVPTTPFLDLATFSWIRRMEDNWRDIRSEMEGMLAYRDALPAFHKINGDATDIRNDDWKSFFFYGFGKRIEANCQRVSENRRAHRPSSGDDDRVLFDRAIGRPATTSSRAMEGVSSLPFGSAGTRARPELPHRRGRSGRSLARRPEPAFRRYVRARRREQHLWHPRRPLHGHRSPLPLLGPSRQPSGHSRRCADPVRARFDGPA